jgi:hypothetical protein
VQRAIAGPEALVFEEERVVQQREGVEDIEARLEKSVYRAKHGKRVMRHTFLDKMSASRINSFSLAFNLP